MNPGPNLSPQEDPDVPAPAPVSPDAVPQDGRSGTAVGTSRSFWERFPAAVLKWGLGSLLSTFLLGSLVVVGWTTRAARRQVLVTWWRRSPVWRRGARFPDGAEHQPALASEASWPRWILGERTGPGLKGLAARLAGGFVENLRTGLAMAFNTAVLTLPGGLLWAVSWFAGWQNSFNKGYEHAWFGPTVYVLGMLAFTAAMAYVPLAQARQASTGDWRRFYDFRLVGRLIRRHWLASLGLALLWAGASGGVLLVKLAPAFAQYVPALADATPSGALEISERFFLGTAMVLFPVFVLLRLAAARVYAHALCSAFQSGLLTADDLSESEWHAFRRLDLLTARPAPRRRWFVRLARWLATRSGQITAAAAVFAIWFLFSFFVAVSEFVSKTEWGRGWWNQPLIQLPWFDYTPQSLRQAARPPEAAPERGTTSP